MSQISVPHIHLRGADLKHTGARLHQWAIAWLRQLSWKTVAVAFLTVAAVTFLLLALAEVGFDQLTNAFVNSSPIFLILAFLASQFRFQALALALRGAMGKPLPWWRTTQLQYAIQLFALSTPGDSARLVMTVNFASKCGSSREEALGKAPLATITGWFVDFAVIIIAGAAVGVGLHGSGVIDDVEGVWPILLLALICVLAAVVCLLLVRQVRTRVVPPIVAVIKETWYSLRSPKQVAQMFGGGLLDRLGFAACLMAAVAATGHGITYWEALLVGGGSLVVGGLIPTPGGIGVAEGALATGLILMGVPEASAVGAGLIQRSFNVYLPPVYGLVALRDLRKVGLL